MSLAQDLRYAWRASSKRPSFTLTVVIILAVALGANIAVFSVVDGILLRDLPYAEAERLVDLSILQPPVEGSPERRALLDGESLEAWRESAGALAGLAVYRRQPFVLAQNGLSERVAGAAVSADLFTVLGVGPDEGRAFHREEEKAGGEPVAMISQRLRRQHLASGEALGARLELGGVTHTVVGVMGEEFAFPDAETDVWVPMSAMLPEVSGTIQTQYLPAVARLAAGVTPQQAAAEGQAVVDRRRERGGDTSEGRVQVVPLREQLIADVRPALLAIWVAVGLVLLVACANLANLLLARAASRRRELAIRSAIGGGRLRLVRQLLTENVLLSLLGGTAGLLLAAGIHRMLPRLAPVDLVGLERVAFDVRVFAFAFLLTLATAFLFGLFPALKIVRSRLVEALHGGVGEAPSHRRSQGLLVVAEVAVTLVLLIGAGLLLRGFLHLVRVDLGFTPERVLTATLDPAAAGLGASGRNTALFDQLLESVASDRGVAAAGVVAYPPLSPGFSKTNVGIVGLPPARRLAVPQWTSPGYAEAMGLRLVAGRWLRESDHRSAAPVAVVSESFVQQYLAGQDPLRRQVEIGRSTLRLIGVVEDVRLLGFDSEPQPEIFASYRLAERVTGAAPGRLTIAVRTVGEPSDAVPRLRSQVAELAPAVALEDAGPIEEKLSASVAEPRFHALLVGTFAGVALLLTAAGLYGVLSYSVASQRRALGVRRALGAEGGDIIRLVLRRGSLLVLAGTAVGLLVAWWTTRLLSGLLSGLPAGDPASFMIATVVVGVIALAACYLPARRAARLDPLIVLRSD